MGLYILRGPLAGPIKANSSWPITGPSSPCLGHAWTLLGLDLPDFDVDQECLGHQLKSFSIVGPGL